MANSIHGSGGGKSSGGGSKAAPRTSAAPRSTGRPLKTGEIPRLNYSTTDKSSARGRGNESYARQNIADQKANGKSVNDRNFLAETAEGKPIESQQSQFAEEANQPEQRRSNNEYRKQQEKKYSSEANDIGRYGKGNIDLHDRNTGLHDENGNLMTVRSMSFNEDGKEVLVPTIVKRDGKWTQLSDDEAIDWYHRTGEHLGKFDSVEEANQYADRLHKQQESLYVPKENREDLLKEYNKAVEDERTASAWATDDLGRAAAEEATAKRDELEERLKNLNREEGKEVYTDLADEAQSRDLFEGWAGERAAGSAAALGTALEWFDKASDDMVRYEYDQEHGEGAWDRAIAGKNVNQLSDIGSNLFNAAQGWQGQAQEDWASGTEDMSELGKQAAGLGKTAADMTMDMIENFIIPGAGRVAMASRVAGQGALTQDARENNDIDTRMAKAAFDGATAFLSEYLMGGAEAVYGKSVLGGKITETLGKGIKNPYLRKALLNTEGLEEGLEYVLGYAGDKILGFDQDGEFSLGELGQNMLVGYIMGVLFNGIAGGINYDAKKLRAVADEAIMAAQMGITPEEAAQQARLEPDENVKITPREEGEAEPDITPGAEMPTQEATAQQPSNGAWEGWQGWVNETLSGGPISEEDIDTIYRRDAARQAFEEATGVSLDGMTEEEAKATIGMAAGTVPSQNTAAEPTVEPVQTEPETDANEMPLGTEPTQEANDTAGEIPNQEQANTNENAGQNQQQSRPLNEEPPEQRRQKISQYFSNTLTESGRAEGLDPVKYNPTPEAESLTNAAMRLKEDYLGALGNLMKSPAWDGEMVDSAWMIENELFKQWEKTGDRAALDAWKRIETHKISQTAKGLQAVAKQSRPGAAAVLNSIMNEISDVRKANAEAKKAGKTSQVVSEEVLTKAEEKANDIAKRMAHLENMIDDAIASGVSEADAKNAVKNEYLDMIDEINAFRHTGLIQDAKANAEIRNDVKDVNTKFRKWLAEEDMDYIMRFAACDAAGISEDIHYKGKQDFLKRLNTFQKLAQLTGTGTWSRNLVGNASFGLVDVLSAKNPMTWIADMAVSKKTGQRSSGGREKVLGKEGRAAAARALRRSILEVASNIDLATDSDQTKYDMGRTRTYNPDANNIFTRLGSRWEQWNGYMLQSSDAWFKGMAEGSAESAIRKANKWGEDNLTDAERSGMPKDEAKKLSEKRQADLDETKKQIAEYRTFQNDGIAADAANKMRDAFNKFGAKTAGVVGIGDGNWKQGQFGLGTALMPYTKVPTNLGVKSLEFSPSGMVKGMAEIAKVMNDPKATMAQQNKAVTDFGRGATGTALIAVLAALMKSVPWFKDWNNEENLDVRAQNKAEGKSGIQINWSLLNRRLHGDKDSEWRNGDRLADISSMEPVNQLLTTASLIAEQDELSAKGVADAFLSSTHDNLSGLPSLQTLSNIESTWKYADDTNGLGGKLAETAGSTVGSIAGGFIPAPIKHATTAFDPFVRDTSGNDNVERVVNQAKSGLPGARTTLPVKRDAFGNVMTSGDVGTRIANQYSPFKHSQVNQSDVSRELEKVRQATDEVLVPARNPVKKVTYSTDEGKQEIKFSNKDAKDYQALVGKEQELRLKDLFATDLYKNSTPALKAQMIQEVEKFAKDTGKTALAEAFDINFDSDYKDVRNLKDPVDFLMTKTGYNAVTKAEKWDSVDALLQTVRNGKLSDKELDFYEDHIPGFKKMYSMAGSGVGSKRVMDFADALKTQYEGEKRADARGSDYIKVLGSGKFTAKEADTLMDYAPDVKQSTIDRYHEQVNYQLKKAGMSGYSASVWKGIEQVVNGQMEKSAFNKWVNQNVPIQQRQEIKDICTNYAKDRHEAGKTVSSIYKSVREAGFTPQQALEFYEAIDRNYNGSMTKKEYKNALRKVFGSKDGERIWNNMRKHGVQYVTGRF